MSEKATGPVAIVGAGRVGLYLARSLTGVRPLTGIVVRSAPSRERVAAAGFEALTWDDAWLGQASTVLLCVPDDALPLLADELAGMVGADLFVAHMSGRHGIGVLGGLSGPVAAIHPAMTFTGTSADDAIPRGISYGVTAIGQGLAKATSLVADLGGRLELVPDERRPLYHAAICHAANHLNTLVADAADLLRASGVEDTAAVLGPIAHAALANALSSGTAALTGPVVRGDVGTVTAHVDALDGQPAGPAYRAMARRTADRAEAAGRLSRAQADAIRAVLEGGG
jgi:predicted short-subunit dehydrogenase-like oxidoreductase (DUF2520 family)